MAITDVNGASGSQDLSGSTGVITLTTTPTDIGGNTNVVYAVTLTYYTDASLVNPKYTVTDVVRFLTGPNTPIRVYANVNSTYSYVTWHYSGMILS